MSILSRTIQRVRTARFKTDVKAISNTNPCLFKDTAGLFCFPEALFREIHVGPSGKEVFLIPGAFAMTEQYDLFHFACSFVSPLSSMIEMRLFASVDFLLLCVAVIPHLELILDLSFSALLNVTTLIASIVIEAMSSPA